MDEQVDRRQNARLSLVPLSPNTNYFPRTLPQLSPSPSTDSHSHSSSYPAIKSPHPPPRPPRPDAPTSTYNPGWYAPFPSWQSPKRPSRPARPEEALMFNAPSSYQVPTSAHFEEGPASPARYSRNSGTWTPVSDASIEDDPYEVVDLATIVKAEAKRGHRVGPPTVTRSNSSLRKAVPPFIPSQPIASTSRLSIHGFESLLSQGRSQLDRGAPTLVAKGKRREMDRSDAGIFSPRFGLGLGSWGAGAREERRARDTTLASSGVHEQEQHGSAEWRAAGTEVDPASPASQSTIRQPPRRPRPMAPVTQAPTQSDIQPHDDVEVVVVSEPDHIEDHPRDIGLREASLSDGRMDFSLVDYKGWFPRVIHLLYPLFFFAHFPATLFLDYNALYTLAQLAMSPTLPSTVSVNSQGVTTRALSVPTIHPSTAYWVALAMYALCTVLWGFVVCLWRDFIRGYLHFWARGGKVHIGHVYSGTTSFHYACLKSYSYFSFLCRVRLAPFRRTDALRSQVPGTTALDGWCETFAWYQQNWPTVLLLIPRAGLSLAILLLYGTAAYGDANEPVMTRDASYFRPTGVLTSYASGVLLANCAWAAFRLVIVVVSYLALAILSPYTRAVSTSDSKNRKWVDWRQRRGRRLRSAILMAIPGGNSIDETKRARKARARKPARSPRPPLRGIHWEAEPQQYLADPSASHPPLPPTATSTSTAHRLSSATESSQPHRRTNSTPSERTLEASRQVPNVCIESPTISSTSSALHRQALSDGVAPAPRLSSPELAASPALPIQTSTPSFVTPRYSTEPAAPPGHNPVRLSPTRFLNPRRNSDERLVRQELLQRQLTQGALERRRLSEKLLVEVQRISDREDQVISEERRLAGLSRISEASRESTATQKSQALSLDSTPDNFLLPPFRLSYHPEGSPSLSSEQTTAYTAPEDHPEPSPRLHSRDSSWPSELGHQGSQEDRAQTPTQAEWKNSRRQAMVLPASPGALTFGVKSRDSRIPSPMGHREAHDYLRAR